MKAPAQVNAPMTTLNAEEFERALQECASEPIHQIGMVQPHAVLLVARVDGERPVLQASDNIEAVLGLPLTAVLGQPLANVLGAEAVAAVDAMLLRAQEIGSPATAAPATAACTSSDEDMVSIHNTSAPPSARANACSANASRA